MSDMEPSVRLSLTLPSYVSLMAPFKIRLDGGDMAHRTLMYKVTVHYAARIGDNLFLARKSFPSIREGKKFALANSGVLTDHSTGRLIMDWWINRDLELSRLARDSS